MPPRCHPSKPKSGLAGDPGAGTRVISLLTHRSATPPHQAKIGLDGNPGALHGGLPSFAPPPPRHTKIARVGDPGSGAGVMFSHRSRIHHQSSRLVVSGGELLKQLSGAVDIINFLADFLLTLKIRSSDLP